MFAYSKGCLLWGLNPVCGYTAENVDGGNLFACKCDDACLN